ncbi:Protein kinase, partial [Phytophthora palmivora]
MSRIGKLNGKLDELHMSRVGKLDELNMSRIGKLDELNMSRVGPQDELNRSTIGKLNSYLNPSDDSNKPGIFSLTHDDAFTRRHMRKGELDMSRIGKLNGKLDELHMSRVGKLDELNMSRIGKLDELNMSRVGPQDELNRSTIGKLNSYLNPSDDSNKPGIFSLTHDDAFTRRHMRKGGIWDDPVIVAARIPLEKIRIQELIAKGGFGQVFVAAYNGQTVAVKTLLPETAKDMTEINALFAETKVMAKLEHPCIVNFIGIAWESLSTVCCVIEYLVGGDLRALLNHFLDNHTRPRGFDHDKVKIALDIADGLAYLHSMEPNILHRDLKSRNVLLTSQLNAKLTDFGVS